MVMIMSTKSAAAKPNLTNVNLPLHTSAIMCVSALERALPLPVRLCKDTDCPPSYAAAATASATTTDRKGASHPHVTCYPRALVAPQASSRLTLIQL